MAFQGAKDTGQGQFIQLAMMLMDRKRQAQQDRIAQQQAQAKAQQDSVKFALDFEKGKLDLAKARADLRTQLDSESGNLAPLMEAASAPVPADVMAMPVADRQRALAPQQAAADAAIGRLNQIGGDRQDVLGESTRDAAIGAGVGANPLVRKAQARIASDEKSKETKAGKVAGIAGEAEAASWLNKEIRGLRGEISAVRRAGGDTSELEDQIAGYQQVADGVANKGKVSIINPPSPNLIEKWQSAMSSDENAMAVIDRLVKGLDSGEISAGVVGTARYYAEGVQNVFDDLVGTSIIEGPDAGKFQDLISQAGSGVSGIAFKDSNGEQMTLSLDAMTLAWQFARANRDSARITMLEFEKALKALAPTGAFKSEKQFRSALKKVAGVTMRRARKRERVISAMPGMNSELLGALKFNPTMNTEDEYYLNSITRGGKTKARETTPPKENPRLRLQELDETASEDDLLRAIRDEIQSVGAQ